MMPEIALNILDIAENSVRAGASLVEIRVEADTDKDRLEIRITDDGCGMTQEQLRRVEDPFFTSRTTRKVGLGVPFFKQAAESTGGKFRIISQVDEGTEVDAVFGLNHIDRMPLGNMTETIYTLAAFHEEIDFLYFYRVDERSFTLDTRELKAILGNVSLQEREVAEFVRSYLQTNAEETAQGIVI
jgi:anti-sigma regulatory factor (Ser/Thr protein kinase)